MAKQTVHNRKPADGYADKGASPLQKREGKERSEQAEETLHSLGNGVVCDTDSRGHSLPNGRSPLDILVDASEGFIPLWARNTTLRWRFRERSFDYFANPTAAKAEIRRLFGEALLAWGAAAPVTFKEADDVYDFEMVMRSADDCNPGGGCVLASAFFPDSGRHQLQLYPRMFTQSRKEQVDTFIHEVGHIFGLRHFFANVSETAWPSEIFGTHTKFSIMNYGALSELTTADKDDLRRLYQLAWSGALPDINGTPIRFVRPFHVLTLGPGAAESAVADFADIAADVFRPTVRDSMASVAERAAMFLPRSRAAYIAAK